ncbi:MAG: glycosyl hydrolase [Candidatus Omnitrophica bacterium]|nr:glycosyl hydrolase [Candidatus Omnitrophota bacterium]
MKHFYFVTVFIILMLAAFFLLKHTFVVNSYCLTGAFLADNPTAQDIKNFKSAYGKKPFLVMVFIGWDKVVSEETIKNIYSEGCVMVVTWEPWNPASAEAIDYDKLLCGGYDSYIASFARQIKSVPGTVFIRFAHEANGNWYPWSGVKIGKQKYIALYRYVKDRFDALGVTNAKWIFSINCEDVPNEKNNRYLLYYPGDDYVDYIGIDGYNWGDTKPWSKWMSFAEIFSRRLEAVIQEIKKPVLITEFSSTSSGGDKAAWIAQALKSIKIMKNIKGFVLFNHDKETDWNFPPDSSSGRNLKQQLQDSYFKEKND